MILDNLENIRIIPGITPLPNYHSILHLRHGIIMLYENMKELQNQYWERRYPGETPGKIEIYKKASLSFSGEINEPDATGINLCFWYSTNLINFAKSCGLVKFLNERKILPEQLAQKKELIDELKQVQDQYIELIPELKEVRHFRNKAGAHLAFTYPHKKFDTSATIIESISLIPTLIHGKFMIGAFNMKRGESESSFGKNQWSLTENFESLISRYFKQYLK